MGYDVRLSFGRWLAVLGLAGLWGCGGGAGSPTASTTSGTIERPKAPAQSDPVPASSTEPLIEFSASAPTIDRGNKVRLTWSSQNASRCTASNGWSGSRPARGSEVVGPLTSQTTFALNCSGPGGSAVAMLSIRVMGRVTLRWRPPLARVDGSELEGLKGYRIYYGTDPRDYDRVVAVKDARASRHSFELPSGEYYFAMTAIDSTGRESGYSNEVIRRVN